MRLWLAGETMPSLPPYLQRKSSGVFWFRLRVPADVEIALGRREFHHSLKTHDLAEAKTRLSMAVVSAQGEIERARVAKQAPAKPGTRRRARYSHFDFDDGRALSDAEIGELVTSWFVDKQTHDLNLSASDAAIRAEMIADDPTSGEITYWRDTIELLETRAVRCDRLSFDRVLARLKTAKREREARLLHRTMAIPYTPDPEFAELSSRSKTMAATSITLRDLIQRQKRSEERRILAEKTVLKRETQYRFFEEIIGESTRIADIDRQFARKIRTAVDTLPANWSKKLTISERQQVLSGTLKGTWPSMNTHTANSYLIAWAKLMKYAEDEGLIGKSPAAGMSIKSGSKKPAAKRRAFTGQELQRIFDAPIFRGCRDDDAGYSTNGKAKPRRHRFWIPLIGLFTGMRLQEICQLSPADIVVRDGISLINVHDGRTNKLKNASANRTVPIHSELRRVGLLEYVADQKRKGSQSLFSALRTASTGYLSDNFSKWFSNFRDHVRLVDDDLTFHSFRHGFRDLFREAGVMDARILQIGGWSTGGSTAEHYGSGFSIVKLDEAMQKLSIPGLSLNHLHRNDGAAQ